MSRFDIDVKRIPLEFSPETANPAVPVQRKGKPYEQEKFDAVCFEM